MPPEIRVLLVDDHPLFRRGLVSLLAEEPGMQVVGEAADIGEALRQVERTQPDVVLLDNHLPGVRGVDAVAGLHTTFPLVKILMLTVSDDAADLATALRAGASGYLLKTCDIGEIVAAIRRAQHGQVIVGADMAPKLMEAMRDPAQQEPLPATTAAEISPEDDTEPLSPRERQIAVAIARGASNKVIARDLDIAETTVKVHVQSILRKLNLSSRVQIAVYASEKGWAT
ncbi:MAG: response regulator [Thiomonas sp.]